ncbi:hypothetical protein RJ639_025065 [Escallonia herrerae]|uniref:Protein FAR1-RELATED SEQUENCE n=1 Tax=Escallonia herrerae TaxID=1293975 RepID=A0AA88UX49_9ASTE|nr:hypothetical protein RJ639_025065 [Escallonia herrerae]
MPISLAQTSLLIEQIDANECLADHDILDSHVCDELETVDYDVWGLSHCDDEVEMHKENETYGSFEDFNSECVAAKTFDTQEAAYEFYSQYALLMVTLLKKLEMWVVDKFQDVHNHPLTTTPSKVIKHRSHSKYNRTNVCKSLVAALNNEGLKPSQITKFVNVIKPSKEADVTPRQCSSIIHVDRERMLSDY